MYKFLDENQNDITNECLVDFLAPMEEEAQIAEEELNYDDMLISTLIMLSPQKILWHFADESSEIAQTVKKIFEQKVNFVKSVNHNYIM